MAQHIVFCTPTRRPLLQQEVTSIKDQGQYRMEKSKADQFVPVTAFVDAFNGGAPSAKHRDALMAEPYLNNSGAPDLLVGSRLRKGCQMRSRF